MGENDAKEHLEIVIDSTRQAFDRPPTKLACITFQYYYFVLAESFSVFSVQKFYHFDIESTHPISSH